MLTHSLSKVDLFVRGPNRQSQWFQIGPMSIYLRNTERYINNECTKTVDIGNVSVDSKHSGKGEFTRFLEWLEQHDAVSCIYVENVLTLRFCSFFERKGYTKVGKKEDGCPSYFKKVC